MSDTPTAFCPGCRGPREVPDPLTEYLEVCVFHYRRTDLPGSADALVSLLWRDSAAVETAEEMRAACDAIHRPWTSPPPA